MCNTKCKKYFFLSKYLVISKKSSTFVPDLWFMRNFAHA